MKITCNIEGKTALVTGANRGIGKAIVEAFLRRGVAKIYAAVRNPASANALSERYGERLTVVQFDLSKPETIMAAAHRARDVEVVVNNAAVFKAHTPFDPDAIDAIELGMQINVYGLMRVAQAFAPILKKNGGGAFVQMNSIASLKCAPDFATHSATKAASYSITQALRELLSQQGTAVLSVHPGLIATDMSGAAALQGIAEPPLVVAEGIIAALESGIFHLFPDAMAKRIGSAYQSFASSVIEAELAEYKKAH
ncbi:SDR family oxidoreductase [Nitrosospira sp. Is2]|uniref:SDR family oxidoreductase n=1 Tax=Nitrosospira sp. Is2 TaxID=3080532 RepID=UPI00295552DC|nr:SDR family oxidoreductase [Nitrosospira sp. Is2]WON73125.1 SDR family oxidoreductase [Nitrosospira sp. Is2]